MKKLTNSSDKPLYIFRILLVLFSTFSIYLFWENTILISLILTVFAILINYKAQKFEVLYFVIVAILATIVESIAMSSGAWTYENQNILNFPIWLPLYWGMGGVALKDIYQVFKNQSR